MSRPQYSIPAFIRKMQISRANIFIFVEGYKDRYVYSKIASSECDDRSIVYELVTSEEIPLNGFGKQVLLKFFTYLRHHLLLLNKFKDKTTISIFFLDKDVDDLLRKKRRSEHIVYTEMYELENYLYVYGDISEASAVSVALEISTISDHLGDYLEWRQNAASCWKEWVKLCLFSHGHKINSPCNYSSARSQINNGVYGSVMSNEHNCQLLDLRSRSGLQGDQFNLKFTRLSRRVDKIYSQGKYDLLFKGKWYTCFLVKDLRRIARSRRINKRSLGEKLENSLALTLNVNDNWAEYFRVPIRRLINRAGI